MVGLGEIDKPLAYTGLDRPLCYWNYELNVRCMMKDSEQWSWWYVIEIQLWLLTLTIPIATSSLTIGSLSLSMSELIGLYSDIIISRYLTQRSGLIELIDKNKLNENNKK